MTEIRTPYTIQIPRDSIFRMWKEALDPKKPDVSARTLKATCMSEVITPLLNHREHHGQKSSRKSSGEKIERVLVPCAKALIRKHSTARTLFDAKLQQ